MEDILNHSEAFISDICEVNDKSPVFSIFVYNKHLLYNVNKAHLFSTFLQLKICFFSLNIHFDFY